jgi:hypothetical protein
MLAGVRRYSVTNSDVGSKIANKALANDQIGGDQDV